MNSSCPILLFFEPPPTLTGDAKLNATTSLIPNDLIRRAASKVLSSVTSILEQIAFISFFPHLCLFLNLPFKLII